MDVMVTAEDVWEKVNNATRGEEGRVSHKVEEDNELTTDSEYDWENCTDEEEEEEMEEEEVERMNKIEELHQILERLRELKQEGQHKDILEKVAIVKETLA